ncbi:MAG: ParB/RepB/Spo0J family partition protein [Rhodospirillales bacterium]|nr:ParB/RepB/Spo0J family partition protein [Rhodospirillales bacterium]
MCAKEVSPRLGRGLAALLGDIKVQPEPNTPAGVRTVAIDLLDPNPFQPRTTFDPDALQELADSIRSQGILQPLLVRMHPDTGERFQIIAGERRWRAAGLAGLHEVPVLLREMTDSDAAAAALVENLQRQDLNPMDEAEGYQRLVQEFGLTHEAMGEVVGKSRAHIGNMLRLLRLPDRAKTAVRTGDLTFGHARALLGLDAPDSVLDQVIGRGLSVRQTEALVSRRNTVRPAPEPTPADSDTRHLETRLANALGQRVQIAMGAKGAGALTIRFGDLYQLEQLVDRLVRE